MLKIPNNLTKQLDKDFSHVYGMIMTAKTRMWQQINNTLIAFYWDIGKYVSNKIENDGWGKAIVERLSYFIQAKDSSVKGFSARNIWRMKQFYESYNGQEKLPALLTEISWSNHLHILSKTKTYEEKEFYIQLAIRNRYSERDFARLIDSATYERTKLADQKLSAPLTEFPKNAKGIFKDSYVFEFLSIPDNHQENDLKQALLKNLKKFLLELGPDFSFIGQEYVIQVGTKDYRIDLLMHNRELNCMAAFEIKVTEFQPEYLGKLQFYLEALDRDIKKPHENPSIGILICKTKDEEVVKYALSRNVSPAIIAEYETKLINKRKLQEKLQEFSGLINESNFQDELEVVK